MVRVGSTNGRYKVLLANLCSLAPHATFAGPDRTVFGDTRNQDLQNGPVVGVGRLRVSKVFGNSTKRSIPKLEQKRMGRTAGV